MVIYKQVILGGNFSFVAYITFVPYNSTQIDQCVQLNIHVQDKIIKKVIVIKKGKKEGGGEFNM